MLRELKGDLGMCISVIILSFLAVLTYCGFNGDVIGFRKELKNFYQQTNFADGWIYSEGFSKEELEAVRDLEFVADAQLRTQRVVCRAIRLQGPPDAYLVRRHALALSIIVW